VAGAKIETSQNAACVHGFCTRRFLESRRAAPRRVSASQSAYSPSFPPNASRAGSDKARVVPEFQPAASDEADYEAQLRSTPQRAWQRARSAAIGIVASLHRRRK